MRYKTVLPRVQENLLSQTNRSVPSPSSPTLIDLGTTRVNGAHQCRNNAASQRARNAMRGSAPFDRPVFRVHARAREHGRCAAAETSPIRNGIAQLYKECAINIRVCN
jgi:hypothetical protein